MMVVTMSLLDGNMPPTQVLDAIFAWVLEYATSRLPLELLGPGGRAN